MRDPIVQVDLQVGTHIFRFIYIALLTYVCCQAHIVTFLREAASRNSPEFTAVVGQLKPEEVQVVRKAVSA